MRTKTSYSMEEKQQLVNEFAKRGLSKWEFIRLHPEYKRTTIYSWLQKYFPSTTDGNCEIFLPFFNFLKNITFWCQSTQENVYGTNKQCCSH